MRSRHLLQSNAFFAVIVALMGFSSWYSYYRIQEMIDSSGQVNHSNLVTLKIEEVLSFTKDAETSQRGFIITRDHQFLEPSIGSARRVSATLQSLDSLLQDHEMQMDYFTKFRGMVLSRLQHLEKTRNFLLSPAYNPDTLHSHLLEGKEIMDSVREQAALMEKIEQNLLDQRTQQNQVNISIIPILTLTVSLFLLLLVIITFILLRNRYQELDKAKTQFKELLKHAPDAVVIVDNEGYIQIVNLQAEKMFGYTREELIGKKVEVLIPEQLKHNHASHRNNYFEDPKFREMGTDLDLKGRRKDGSEFPVEISLSPLKTKDGVLVTAAIRDITRRKKTEEELRQRSLEVQKKNQELQQTNAQLESFNYIASHDLREPIRKIQVFTGKILDAEDGNISEKGRDYFKRIENSCSRMQEMIESLFNYSTLGKQGMKFSNVDLNGILSDVKNNFSDLMEDKNAVLYSEKLPTVTADPVQMYELFSNLVDNAIKYSKENIAPVINITVSRIKGHKPGEQTLTSNYWKISFRDNGIGFDSLFNEKVFELFRRLHGKQDYSGTGIGLAICKKVVENHGGSIIAESSPGEGSTFHINLPETIN